MKSCFFFPALFLVIYFHYGRQWPWGNKTKISSLLILDLFLQEDHIVEKWDWDKKWAHLRFMTLWPDVVQSPLTNLTGTMESNLRDRSREAYICTFDLIIIHLVNFIFIICNNISISFNPEIYFQIVFFGDKTKYGFLGGYRKWLHLDIGQHNTIHHSYI